MYSSLWNSKMTSKSRNSSEAQESPSTWAQGPLTPPLPSRAVRDLSDHALGVRLPELEPGIYLTSCVGWHTGFLTCLLNPDSLLYKSGIATVSTSTISGHIRHYPRIIPEAISMVPSHCSARVAYITGSSCLVTLEHSSIHSFKT